MLTLIATAQPRACSDGQMPSASVVRRQQWAALAAGSIAASIMASLLAAITPSLELSPLVIITAALTFVTASSLAGALGTWIAQLSSPSVDASAISLQSLAAWAFFPAIALFCNRRSPLVLLPAAVAAIAASTRLRGLFPDDTVSTPFIPPRAAREFNSIYGLPAPDSKPLLAALTSISIFAALFSTFDQRLLSAAALLGIGISLPLWRWSEVPSRTLNALRGARSLCLVIALSVLFTILAMAPPSFANGLWPFFPHHRPLVAAHPSGSTNAIHRDYVSIILLPPPAKHTRIIPPPPDSGPGTTASKSVVIPFDGSYWYFQSPAVRPSTQGRTAHGKPTDVDVRATNSVPLAMEAHQDLGVPIDLSYCRAIDLTVTNADARPGPIALTIRLEDSKAYLSLDLGKLTIASSAVTSIPQDRAPVQETLRFLIPPSAAIRRFDRIAVIYTPSGVRSHVGAKVSVDSFTLVPR